MSSSSTSNSCCRSKVSVSALVAASARDLEIGLAIDKLAQSVAYDLVVIGEQDASFLHGELPSVGAARIICFSA
jgi:hypothetical protein